MWREEGEGGAVRNVGEGVWDVVWREREEQYLHG